MNPKTMAYHDHFLAAMELRMANSRFPTARCALTSARVKGEKTLAQSPQKWLIQLDPALHVNTNMINANL